MDNTVIGRILRVYFCPKRDIGLDTGINGKWVGFGPDILGIRCT
jgi:hypothetical protein